MMERKETMRRAMAKGAAMAALAIALAMMLLLAACSGAGSGQTQGSPVSSSGSGKTDIAQASVLLPEKCRTTGFAIEPKMKVVCDGQTLVRDVDYEVSYENNKKPGVASVTVTGIGEYEGTTVRQFQISGRYNPRVLVLDKSRNSASGMVSFLRRCGCRPVFTSSTDVDISKFDALAIPGGGDVDPAFYGEENLRSHRVYTWLDEAQIQMIRAFAKAGKPVFGICRGAQIINIAFGGSLYQHIENGHDGTFPTATKRGSWLYGLYGEDDLVLTFHGHHQAIRELGEGLVATQWSRKDELRVVELIEHYAYPIWAVQYHPECMGKSGDAIGVKFRAEVLKRI